MKFDIAFNFIAIACWVAAVVVVVAAVFAKRLGSEANAFVQRVNNDEKCKHSKNDWIVYYAYHTAFPYTKK